MSTWAAHQSSTAPPHQQQPAHVRVAASNRHPWRPTDFVPQHNVQCSMKEARLKKKTHAMSFLHECRRCIVAQLSRSCHATLSIGHQTRFQLLRTSVRFSFFSCFSAQKHGAADQKQSKNIHPDSKNKAKTWARRANTSKHNPANVFANEEVCVLAATQPPTPV